MNSLLSKGHQVLNISEDNALGGGQAIYIDRKNGMLN